MHGATTIPAGTSVSWSFSTDGGAAWMPIEPNAQQPVFLPQPARSVLLQAALTGTETETPAVESYRLILSGSSDMACEEGLRFTGKELDASTGLEYFGARYYDPEIGRFTTVDPAESGLNWYAYCRNNPLLFTDPTGLRELIDGDPATGNMFTVIRDKYSDFGYHIVEGGNVFSNHVAVAIANTALTGDMKWINSVDDTLRASNSASLAMVFGNVGAILELAFDKTGTSYLALARIDALAFLIGFGMDIAGNKNGPLSIRAKLRLAKSIGGIPRSASPIAQGRYGNTLWWEYKDYNGNIKIVVQHPDGSVHVGVPKPQSKHDQGGPPKYYSIPGSGHVGE